MSKKRLQSLERKGKARDRIMKMINNSKLTAFSSLLARSLIAIGLISDLTSSNVSATTLLSCVANPLLVQIGVISDEKNIAVACTDFFFQHLCSIAKESMCLLY